MIPKGPFHPKPHCDSILKGYVPLRGQWGVGSAAWRSCGCSIPGGTQGWFGWGFGQPELLGGHHGRGLELDDFKGPLQHKPFHGSMIGSMKHNNLAFLQSSVFCAGNCWLKLILFHISSTTPLPWPQPAALVWRLEKPLAMAAPCCTHATTVKHCSFSHRHNWQRLPFFFFFGLFSFLLPFDIPVDCRTNLMIMSLQRPLWRWHSNCDVKLMGVTVPECQKGG